MPYLVRKINLAKWRQVDLVNSVDVSADAITNCLRTYNNTLSVWTIDSIESINEAILAIVAGSDHLDTIDLVVLDRSFLEENGVQIKNTPGETCVEDLKNTHRDLSELSLSKLDIISKHIAEKIREDITRDITLYKDSRIRFTRGVLKGILSDAIRNGRLNLSDLKESIRVKL